MQPDREITFHPLDLSEHGKTPAGKPLFRIVRGDTRLDKVKFEGRIHELPRYEVAEGKWVLEKWLSAEALTQMTPEQYEALLTAQVFGTAQMPYPTDGDYELSYVFVGSVDIAKAHAICAMIQFGHQNATDAERADAVLKSAEKKAFDADALKDNILKTALTKGNTIHAA